MLSINSAKSIEHPSEHKLQCITQKFQYHQIQSPLKSLCYVGNFIRQRLILDVFNCTMGSFTYYYYVINFLNIFTFWRPFLKLNNLDDFRGYGGKISKKVCFQSKTRGFASTVPQLSFSKLSHIQTTMFVELQLNDQITNLRTYFLIIQEIPWLQRGRCFEVFLGIRINNIYSYRRYNRFKCKTL